MKKPARIEDHFILIYQPEHPRAFAAGYVPEHILVAERSRDRPLTPDEDVRHINGNPHDNRPVNLEIVSSSNMYKSSSVENSDDVLVRASQSTAAKTYIHCPFQRPCWKTIRAPIARANKIYLPYSCSWEQEGDIYKCSHFWKFLDAKMADENKATTEER